MFYIFDKAGYIRTVDGLELYQGSELVEMLSDREQLGIFFEVTTLPSGARLVQISKHGDAREVSKAFETKKRIWARSGWPVDNLHLICLNVAAITDRILEEINTALFVEDLVLDLGSRIMELMMAPAAAEAEAKAQPWFVPEFPIELLQPQPALTLAA